MFQAGPEFFAKQGTLYAEDQVVPILRKPYGAKGCSEIILQCRSAVHIAELPLKQEVSCLGRCDAEVPRDFKRLRIWIERASLDQQ